jgi:hypothetical protein
MALKRANDLNGKALHETIYVDCPHCGGRMEASSVVKAYQNLAARRYRARHTARTALACRKFRGINKPEGEQPFGPAY